MNDAKCCAPLSLPFFGWVPFIKRCSLFNLLVCLRMRAILVGEQSVESNSQWFKITTLLQGVRTQHEIKMGIELDKKEHDVDRSTQAMATIA